MSDTKLGNLITDENSKRDAIHIAIAPVVAGEDLRPGTPVGQIEDGTFVSKFATIGIVDPFLKKKVRKGEGFWLCLYQNTITGMRHHWEHPDFKASELKEDSLAPVSVKWIKDYAESLNVGYQDLMDSAHSYIKYGEYMVRGGVLESISTSDKFWEHYYNVTGERGDGNFFSCSC